MRQNVDYDILAGIATLEEAVASLSAAKRARRATSKITSLEEEVCMGTRTLFYRYVDKTIWSGNVDRKTYLLVRKALRAGSKAISRSKEVRDSVKRRLGEFEDFSANAPALFRSLPAKI